MTTLEELEKLTEELTLRDSAMIKDYRIMSEFFDTTNDMICVISFSGIILKVNDSILKTLEWTNNELCGNEFYNFLHPECKEKVIKKLTNTTDIQAPFKLITRFLKSDGEYTWLNWQFTTNKRNLFFATARPANEDCVFCSKNIEFKM